MSHYNFAGFGAASRWQDVTSLADAAALAAAKTEQAKAQCPATARCVYAPEAAALTDPAKYSAGQSDGGVAMAKNRLQNAELSCIAEVNISRGQPPPAALSKSWKLPTCPEGGGFNFSSPAVLVGLGVVALLLLRRR